MAKPKAYFLVAKEAQEAIGEEDLLDVLMTLQEQGILDRFEILSGGLLVYTSMQDRFDIHALFKQENDQVPSRSMSKKPA